MKTYMYHCLVHNERYQDWIDLTQQSEWFSIAEIEGIGTPKSDINITSSVAVGGGFFNSSHVDTRNIVLTVVPRGNIEMNRQRLYQLFPIGDAIDFRFKTARRDVVINGYVESIDGSFGSNPQTFTVSIICPNPYWQDRNISTIDVTSGGGFRNDGDIKDGVNIRLKISDSFSGNAVQGLKITNYLTGEYIGFTSGFIHSDEIIVSTIAGQLRAECRRVNYGTINLLKYLADGSTWIKAKFGDNAFSITTTNSTAQYITGTISHTNQYLGV